MPDEELFDTDMNTVTIGWPFGDSGNKRATLKGRCQNCWASLIAKSNKNHKYRQITCRSCGETVTGKDAEDEWERMLKEQLDNAVILSSSITLAQRSTNPGPFIWKIFPPIDRESSELFLKRIRTAAQVKQRHGKLGRGQFPLGAPGLLMRQAGLLVEGLSAMPSFKDKPTAIFPHSELREDGTLSVFLTKEELDGGEAYREERMLRMMGINLMASMTSAFACELVMKAICLTRKNECLKSHDLQKLYEDLPPDSRVRIELDYPDLPKVLSEGRERFGKWRYFEQNVGENSIASLLPSSLSNSLLKSARVILDEAEIVGLSGSINLEAKQDVRLREQERFERYHFLVNIKGGESPCPKEKTG